MPAFRGALLFRAARRVTKLLPDGWSRLGMSLIVLASCLGAASVVGACVIYLHTNTRPLVALAGRAYPKVLFSVATRQKLVALTIDDGPHPAVTPGLLDTLSHFGVKATFFIIGSNAIRWPQLLDDIAKQGHELANHLMEDEPAYTLTTAQFEEQLIQVDNLLQPHWGAEGAREGSKWFRPGHGWVREWMFPLLKKHGYRTALGSIYAHDPMIRSKPLIASMLKKQVHPGGIIILHDGGFARKQTVDILKDVIPQYRSRGYEIVTLTELVSRTSRTKRETATPEVSDNQQRLQLPSTVLEKHG